VKEMCRSARAFARNGNGAFTMADNRDDNGQLGRESISPRHLTGRSLEL
jgi:hypothetical protein